MKKLIALGIFIFMMASCSTSEKVVIRDLNTGETKVIKIKKNDLKNKTE